MAILLHQKPLKLSKNVNNMRFHVVYSIERKKIIKLENTNSMIIKRGAQSTNLCNNSCPEYLDLGRVHGWLTGLSINDRFGRFAMRFIETRSSKRINGQRQDRCHHGDESGERKLPRFRRETRRVKHHVSLRQDVHESGRQDNSGSESFRDEEERCLGTQRREDFA